MVLSKNARRGKQRKESAVLEIESKKLKKAAIYSVQIARPA
eukprot:jgi/Antlo1/903/1734